MEQLSLSLADAMKIDNIRLDDFEYKIVEAVTGSGYEEKVATLALHDGIAHRAARPNMQKFPALIVETHDGQFVGFITFQRNHKENEFCFLQSAIWDEWRCQALYIHMVEIALDQNTDNYPSMVTCSPKSDLETEELFTKAGFETYLKKSGFAFMVKGGVIDGHEVSTFECARLKKLVQLTETNVWNSLKTEWLREKKQWNVKIDNAGEKYDVINPRWATREDCWMTGGGISMAVNGKNHNGGASVLDPFACEVCLTLFMPEFGKRVYNPFGGGVQYGFVAGTRGYEYVASEIRQNQCDANNKICTDLPARWIVSDSSTFEPEGMFDQVFTSGGYRLKPENWVKVTTSDYQKDSVYTYTGKIGIIIPEDRSAGVVYAAMSSVPITVSYTGNDVANAGFILGSEATGNEGEALKNLYSSPYNLLNVDKKYYGTVNDFGTNSPYIDMVLYHVGAKFDMQWNVDTSMQHHVMLSKITLKGLSGGGKLFKPLENTAASTATYSETCTLVLPDLLVFLRKNMVQR